MIVGLSVIGGAAVIGIGWALWSKPAAAAPVSALNPPPTPTPATPSASGTPAATLVDGVNYTIRATAPANTPTAAALEASLANVGWITPTVTSFTAANAPYTATATWGGVANTPITNPNASITIT